MARRCKPGQRARIVGDNVNHGKIVVVVRPYFYPEKIGNSCWPNALFPWVVTSLSGPLRSFFVDSGEEAPSKTTIVADDPDLEPLDDDDDGIPEGENAKQPKPASKSPEALHA